MNRRRIKRGVDLLIGVPLFLMASPAMAVVAFLSRLWLGPPAFYKQRRPGLSGRPFTLYKFRTMTDARNPDGTLKADEKRLTPFGRFLRETSLDELPELFNVLKGEMSLVGPRPLLMRYLERYSPEQARRHEVKPGITGWAQVNGRNLLSWEERFNLDVWYVDHHSIGLDLKILAHTFEKVVRRQGIRHPGKATMNEFMGSGAAVPKT